MRQHLMFTLLAALAGTLTGCSHSPAQLQAAASPDSVVRTSEVQTEMVVDGLDLPARVQADPARMVRVFPPGGGRVVSVLIRPGDHVRQGQPLAVLSSNDVATARSEYNKARADKERTERGLKRAQLLYDHKVLAEKEYLDAKTDATTAEGEYERTRQRLLLLGVPLEGFSDQLRVTAPRSGVVLDLGTAAGEFSKALDAAQPLCTVADLSSVWVLGDVYEKDLGNVAVGRAVSITVPAYPGRTWDGHVDRISDIIDPNTRTAKLRVILPNADLALKPDMFAQIHIVIGRREAVMLPAQAVLHDGDTAFVMVARAGGDYERRIVTLGRTQGRDIEVKNGLISGDQVVTENAALLRSNQGGGR